MKKFLLALLMLLTMGISGFAQYPVTVTIGTGSSSTYTMPFDNYYKNSWDQMIYPASQIGVGGYITSISFYVDAVPTSNYPFSTLAIYMGVSEDSVNTSTTSWLPMSELTQVYSATNLASPTATGWQTFTLDTPFPYDGANNLVIVTSKTMSTYSSALKYRYTTGATNCCMYRHSDSDASYATHPGSAAATGRVATRPNLQMTINVSSDFCYPVSNLTVSNLTSTDATIEWNSSSSAVGYILQYKTDVESWTNATTVDLTDTTYDLSGMLTPTTSYNVRVASDCGGDTSLWRNLSFTTPCSPVSTLPFTENFDFYPGSTTGSTNNLPDCWNYLNTAVTSSYAGYPINYNSSTYAESGSNSLRFYSYYYSATSAYGDQMAILPQIDPSLYPTNTLQLSFDARKYSTSYPFKAYIGVITNPSLQSTFVAVDSIESTSTTYSNYEIPFSQYTGPDGFIAILVKQPASSYNAGHIDNIVVDVIPTCPKPKNLTTVSTTLNSIELGWDEMGTATMTSWSYTVMFSITVRSHSSEMSAVSTAARRPRRSRTGMEKVVIRMSPPPSS